MQEVFKWLFSQFQPLHILIVCIVSAPILIALYPVFGPLNVQEIIVAFLVLVAVILTLSKLIMMCFKTSVKDQTPVDPSPIIDQKE